MGQIVLRNYRGKRYRWKQPREEALVEAGNADPHYAVTVFEETKKPSRRRRAS